MEALTMRSGGFGKRVSLGLAGLVVAIVMYAGMSFGSVAHASAEGFCDGVTLAPYGNYGDRCYAWVWEAHPYLAIVSMETRERAGCMTSAAGEGYELRESWYCIGNYGSGFKYVNSTPEPRRGVIRNNNLNYSGKFYGAYTCCWDH
jgi:hypothetical protein